MFFEAQFSSDIIPLSIKFMCCDFYGYAFNLSRILCSNAVSQILYDLLSTRLGTFHTELIFQSIEHGTTSAEFYNHCNGKSPTIILIQSKFGNIFGAYSTVKWGISNNDDLGGFVQREDANAFLFTLKIFNEESKENSDVFDEENTETFPKIFPIKESQNHKAVYMYPCGGSCIFHFGCASDLSIFDYFDEHNGNFCTDGGWTYDSIKRGYEICGKGFKKSKPSGGGNYNIGNNDAVFCVKQMEVFHIRFKNEGKGTVLKNDDEKYDNV